MREYLVSAEGLPVVRTNDLADVITLLRELLKQKVSVFVALEKAWSKDYFDTVLVTYDEGTGIGQMAKGENGSLINYTIEAIRKELLPPWA